MPFGEEDQRIRERAIAEGISPQDQVQARISEERQREEARKAFNDYVSYVMTETGQAYRAGAASYAFFLSPEWSKERWERLQANYPYGHTVIDLAKVAEAVTEHMLKEAGYTCVRVGDRYEIRF